MEVILKAATDSNTRQELQETAQKILGQVILKKGKKIGKVVSAVIEQGTLYAVVSVNECSRCCYL